MYNIRDELIIRLVVGERGVRMTQGVGREKKYRKMDSMRVQRFVPVASKDIYKIKMSDEQEAEFAKRCEKLNRK